MRKFITIILLTLFTLFTFEIKANNEYDCQEDLKRIFEQIDSKLNSEEQDSSKRENYNEIIFNTILGEKGTTLSDKKNNMESQLGSCFAMPIEKDVAIKILRLLYGEAINTPINIFSTAWASFWGKDSSFNESKLNEETDILNVIPDIIVSYNVIIFWIGLIIIAIVYGRDLVNFISKGDQRLIQNLSKNYLRILTGISFIAPLPFLDGYSMIQFVFIALIIASVLLAKILWIFILLSINFSYFERDVQNIVEEHDLVEVYKNSITDNVLMHYCDITMRESILNRTRYEFKNQKALLEQNNYQKCLKTDLVIDNVLEDKASYFIPKEVRKGAECGIKYAQLDIQPVEYCGNIKRILKEDLDEEAASKANELQVKFYKALNVESESYQQLLRNMAYDIRKHNCKLDNNNNLNAAENPFRCPVTDNTGEYLYNTETGYINFINDSFNSSEERRNSLINIIDKNYEPIKSNLYNKIIKLFVAIIAEEVKLDNKQDDLKNFIVLYEKGFAMAGSVFFEKIDYLIPNERLVEHSKEIYKVQIGEYQELLLSKNYNTGLQFAQIAYEDYKIKLTKPGASTITLLREYWEDMSNYDTDISAITASFEKEKELKENRKPIFLNWNELTDTDSSCIHDFSLCKNISTNPFMDLMVEGQDMFSTGVFVGVGFKVAKWMFKGVIPSGILDIVSNLINIYVLVGFFFGIIIPFIPFFIFASSFFAWIIQTLKIIFATQMLSVYFLIPDHNEDFAGREKKLYKLLIKTALMPLLLITGFLVTVIIANISIGLINLWLSIIMESFNLNPEFSILGMIEGMVAILIYLVFVTLAVIQASKAISSIPKAMSKWLEIETEEEYGFQELKTMIQSYIIPNMKKNLFL